MVRLIIFDLDGVLVDACEWHRVALNSVLKEVCNYEISLDDHYNTFNGTPTKVKLKKLTEMGIIDEKECDKIYTLKQAKTVDIITVNARIRQEKIDLINWLHNNSIRTACYTNSIRFTANLMLEKTGVLNLLEAVVTNQDVKKPKPDPEGYLKILEELKVDKSRTLIIEDSPKGIAAAEASGCNVMQVKNPDEVSIKSFKEYLSENFNSNGR